MTNEEALKLAKLAWPNNSQVAVDVEQQIAWCNYSDETLLDCADRERFEQALRVLAGRPCAVLDEFPSDTIPTVVFDRVLSESESALVHDVIRQLFKIGRP